MAKHRTSLLVALIVALIVPRTAHAYLDPASGSMILQAVIGGVAAAALAFKYYWRRIQTFFGYGSTDEPESE
ncbi:MAG: hypothetical protein F4060_06205 [Holophagales bacterium]|nr:hypothetical protein [Holophagales bacterium]MXX62931.1 hypothetical protein [Holophagales bacterium]MYA07416.1 hypothetical protein [Holophagales bacterium]MYC10376.1 hypothetical protein [Holophagales bacterium]MYD21978.1 hypothetical protein [Holophagales bacterium]